MKRSFIRACIGNADDWRLDRESCVSVMSIQLFPRMMLVGSRCTFIGMLSGVENFVVNIKCDGGLCHQRCMGKG